jgi:hypothetical protein
LYHTKIYTKKHIMAFGTLLWESEILTGHALLLRDIVGIGSAPRPGILGEPQAPMPFLAGRQPICYHP